METITNAIGRFTQLGVCKEKIIEVSDGPNMAYISCPSSYKP
jgi:hypothetical protein